MAMTFAQKVVAGSPHATPGPRGGGQT